MNLLSYISLAKQSLVRYDKANQMLRWASNGMSDTQLSKYNFRRLKKFLENKGYEYERPYPYKGKKRCTVSLLDIVRGIESGCFMRHHGYLDIVPIKPDDEQMEKRYDGCTRLEQEEDLPVHSVNIIDVESLGEFDEIRQRRLQRDLKNAMPPTYVLDEDVKHAYLTTIKPLNISKERVQGVNQMVVDIVEGRVEGNPLDLCGITSRAKAFESNPFGDVVTPRYGDKTIMGNQLKTTLGKVSENESNVIDILFSLKSLAARHPDLDPMDIKLGGIEHIEGFTDEQKAKLLSVAAGYFAKNFNLDEALKGVELPPGYSFTVIPKKD